jgi:hypothetical protein
MGVLIDIRRMFFGLQVLGYHLRTKLEVAHLILVLHIEKSVSAVLD